MWVVTETLCSVGKKKKRQKINLVLVKRQPCFMKSLQHWISWFITCSVGNCRAPSQTPMCLTEQNEGLCPKGHFKEKRECVQGRNRSYSGTEKDSHAAQVTNRCRCYTWGQNAHQFNENMAEKKLSKLLQEKTTANNYDGWKILSFLSFFFLSTITKLVSNCPPSRGRWKK